MILLFGCTEQEVGTNVSTDTEELPLINNSTGSVDEIQQNDTNMVEEIGVNSYLSLKENLEYTAEYSTVLFENEEIVTGKLIVYSKDENYRQDTIIGTEETVISLFLLPEGDYSCIDAIGNVVCNDLKTSSNPDVSFENIDNYDIIELPTRVVMNKTGNCFMFSNQNETLEQCFLDTGVPVYLRVTISGGAEFTQSLKDIEYTVDDSVFELPQ